MASPETIELNLAAAKSPEEERLEKLHYTIGRVLNHMEVSSAAIFSDESSVRKILNISGVDTAGMDIIVRRGYAGDQAVAPTEVEIYRQEKKDEPFFVGRYFTEKSKEKLN